MEGAVPKSSGSVYSYDTFKSTKTALASIKETLNTKPTTSECAATHAGAGAQKIFGYVTYTGSVLKSAVINNKTYTIDGNRHGRRSGQGGRLHLQGEQRLDQG